jgi:hypothetical protein
LSKKFKEPNAVWISFNFQLSTFHLFPDKPSATNRYLRLAISPAIAHLPFAGLFVSTRHCDKKIVLLEFDT